MKAWRFSEFGDIGNLRLGEYENPEPGENEALIRVRFAALNPADRLLVEGTYPGAGDLPLSVGRDGAGEIVSAPKGCGFEAGDSVLILRSPVGVTRQGTLAELVTVPVECIARLPKGWSFEEGAASSVVYLTAWKALKVQGHLKEGETVLINGASGGVGVASIQVAKALGARVVALSRDAGKRNQLMELGADIVVDSSVPLAEMEAAVKKSLNGSGADLVIENLGGPFLQSSVNLCNLNGRVMVIGLLAGRKSELTMGLVLFKQVRIEGVHVGKYTATEAQEAWSYVVDTLDRAKVRPVVDCVYAMEEVQKAFAHLSGNHIGKVLVRTQ